MAIVIYQGWEESELGWGIKPDGFSLHVSREEHKLYLERFYASLPYDSVPDTYSRIDGVAIEIGVTDEYANAYLTPESGSIRYFSTVHPSMVLQFLKERMIFELNREIGTIEIERGIT